MDSVLNKVSSTVRGWMGVPALVLHKVSKGRIKPDHITLISLLGHIPVVWALWQCRPLLAAALLAFFGIMDSLDGALARLQKTTSVRGMLFDASSDRVKEVLLYAGLTHYVLEHANTNVVWLPAAVMGGSLVVSYIKAKGEMALMSTSKHDAQSLNRIFSDGIARYEVRMAFIIIGLLTGNIVVVLWVLLILIAVTSLQRIVRVSKALKDV